MKKKNGFFQNVWRYKALILMALPGFIWFIFFFYIPVLANVVAFKDFHISPDGFLASLRESPWVGFENFKFLFASKDAWLITRNTILYNVVFLAFNLFFAIAFAIIMSELRNRRLVKVYHTMSLLPYFLSWMVINYFVYAFLSPDKGILNQWICFINFKHRRYLQSRLWFVLHRTKKLRCALQRDKCVRYLYLQWLNGYW